LSSIGTLARVVAARLRAGVAMRACARGAQHQRRRQAAAVGDPAGRHNRYRARDVDDVGH
jgi:hypothetical protein